MIKCLYIFHTQNNGIFPLPYLNMFYKIHSMMSILLLFRFIGYDYLNNTIYVSVLDTSA